MNELRCCDYKRNIKTKKKKADEEVRCGEKDVGENAKNLNKNNKNIENVKFEKKIKNKEKE